MEKNKIEDLVDKLLEAKDKLNESIELMEEVARETKNSYAESYLIDQLKVHVGSDHGFLSNDFNIDEWIEQIEDEENEKEDN